MEKTYLEQKHAASEITFSSIFKGNPKRNMKEAFEEAEKVKVFVRIRPTNEIKSKCLQIQGNGISIQSLGNQRINRFNFSEVLLETTKQKEVFDKAVLEPVTDFLHGEDALIFTYGATSAGKTFTMQGTTKDIGILPRSIDVIFNSLGPTLSIGQYLKPERDNGYKILTDSEVLEEISLFSSLVKPIEDSRSKSQLAVPLIAKRQIPQNSVDISQRSRDSGSVTLTTDWMSTVWISVVEIYNDQIYDVLAMKKDKQERVLTAPLKLAEEGKGCFFIKNMQEILVRSADEAYQVIQVGIKNLRYASTNLNRSSSRSHSIFQIRVVPQSTKDGSVGKIHQLLSVTWPELKEQPKHNQKENGCRKHA
ncbi:kinesin-like protein KIF20A [Artemia franciscana]|uniref:kinesin-like protein KIF20A n=1 Tax=Artemia franciscana TaxID=6661 RepID=UPI0032D9EC4F